MIKLKAGFTLVEVLVALAIFVGAILIILQLLSVSGKVIIENKTRMQTQDLLLNTLYTCANSKNMPYIVQNKNVEYEFHSDVSTIKTFFGPIDTTSVLVQYFAADEWHDLSTFSAQTSGAIDLNDHYDKIVVSYTIEDWDYIREKRRNLVDRNIYLSYSDVDVEFMVTDDGENVPLSDLQIIDNSKGIVNVSSHSGEWIHFYYHIPKNIECVIIRPDMRGFTVNENVLEFDSNLVGMRTKIVYSYMDGPDTYVKTEIQTVSDSNNITLEYTPVNIQTIRSLTIQGLAQWNIYGSDEKHRENYMIIGN
jgi:prepilin-type N-terminal cleavage/methylation domain-containing protein